MGRLIYGNGREIDIDDYTLAHVKVVILSKLRLGQSFSFSWQREEGNGRGTIWLDRAIPLEFEFDTDTRPSPNRRWIEALLNSANSAEGLRIVPEPQDSHLSPL